jgi:Uma2 family endonuclease
MTQSWSSKWSERTDRLEKLREYQATPSIQRYVILEQKSIGATMFTRKGEEVVAAALIRTSWLHDTQVAELIANSAW